MTTDKLLGRISLSAIGARGAIDLMVVVSLSVSTEAVLFVTGA